MICPNCKKTYGSRVRFCISCGTELVPETDGAVTDIPEDTGADAPESPRETPAIKMNSGVFDGKVPEESDAGFVRKISMNAAKTESRSEGSYDPVTVRKSAKTGKKLGVRIASAAGSAALSALLTAALVLVFGTLTGRGITDERNIANGTKSMDLLSVPAAEIGIDGGDNYAISPGATLEEAVAVMAAGSGVTDGNIRRIYESSTINGFISSALAGYASYIRSGIKPEKITAERVKEVFSENISVISSNTGCRLSEADIALAYEEIDRSEPVFDMLSVNSLENRAGNYIRLIRAFISLPALAAELAAAAVFAALLWFIDRDLRKTLRFIGAPFLITGLAALVFTFMFSMQIGFFSGISGLRHEILKGAAAAASDGMYRTGTFLLVIGIAALLVSSVKTEKA